jgi:sister-chromatid-cohesion protein PDS5
MTILLNRACYRIVNQSSIPTLLKYVQKGQGSTNANTQALAENALTLLTAVSKHSPALYQSHMSELTKAVEDKKNSTLVGVGIQALANVVRWDPKLDITSVFRTMTDRMIMTDCVVKLALGSDWRHAKFAARYLAFSKDRVELCAEIVDVSSVPLCTFALNWNHIIPIGNIR